MTLTNNLPDDIQVGLEQEAERTGMPVKELAGKLLVNSIRAITPSPQHRAPRCGFAEGVDIDALLCTPVPGIGEYLPE